MKKVLKAMLAGVVLTAPMAAFAAIDNTHHDMVYEIGATEKCAYCHSKTVDPATGLGKVGGFCIQVCHTKDSGPYGAGKLDVVPNAPASFFINNSGVLTVKRPPVENYTTLIGGHGSNMDAFAANPLTLGTDTAAGVIATNWPHVNENNTMQCTSCHAVHDNTNPPFLNEKYDAFCERCHSSKASDFSTSTSLNTPLATSTPQMNHPVGFAFDWDKASSYRGRAADAKTDANTKMNARILRYRATGGATGPNAIYAVPGGATADVNLYRGLITADQITDDNSLGINNPNTHWMSAGHLLDTSTTAKLPIPNPGKAPANSRFGCYSCHNAHQNWITPSTDTNGLNALLLGGYDVDDSVGRLNDVCYGCHGSNTNINDPGITGYGHPIGSDVPKGNNHANFEYAWQSQWDLLTSSRSEFTAPYTGSTKTDSPNCIACHDVHGGVQGRMAIRNIMGLTAVPTSGDPMSACQWCHKPQTVAPDGSKTNLHHPSTAGAFESAAKGGFPTDAPWLTADENGKMTDGLTCPDCHVGDGFLSTGTKRSTAHNWAK